MVIKHVTKMCRRLSELNLSGCYKITESGLMMMMTNQTQIQELHRERFYLKEEIESTLIENAQLRVSVEGVYLFRITEELSEARHQRTQLIAELCTVREANSKLQDKVTRLNSNLKKTSLDKVGRDILEQVTSMSSKD